MKRAILTEAPRTPLEKMIDANNGTRRQNWSACSDIKLKMYYQICLENNLKKAQTEAENEIKNRDHYEWLAPRARNIHLLNFTVPDAQYLWQERKTCHRVLQEALDLPSSVGDTFRPSEYLLKAYMLLKCMDHETELKKTEIWITNHMKDQPYSSQIPQLLGDIIAHPGVADNIMQAVQKVNYN